MRLTFLLTFVIGDEVTRPPQHCIKTWSHQWAHITHHTSLDRILWTHLFKGGGTHWAAAVVANELGFSPPPQPVIFQGIPPLRPKQDFENTDRNMHLWLTPKELCQQDRAGTSSCCQRPKIMHTICLWPGCRSISERSLILFCFACSPPEPRK